MIQASQHEMIFERRIMNYKAEHIAKLRRMLDEAKAEKSKMDVMWITKELRSIARANLTTA